MVGLLLQAVLVPVILGVLGDASYGYCALLLAYGRYVLLLDCGLSDGVQRQITHLIATNDEPSTGVVWHTFRRAMLVMAIVGALLFLLVGLFGSGVDGMTQADRWLTVGLAATSAMGLFQFVNYSILFNARSLFRQLAVANAATNLSLAILQLLFVLIFKEAWAFFLGCTLAYSLTLLGMRRMARHIHMPAPRGPWRFTALAEPWEFAKRTFAIRFASTVASTADSILVARALGTQQLGHFKAAMRVPEAAYESMPLTQVFLPEFTASRSSGREDFGELWSKNTRVAFAVGLCLIFVPCCVAPALLPLWLQDKFVSTMPAVMALYALYRAFELYYTTLGASMMGANMPGKVLPFTLFNAVMTVGLAFPAAATYGLAGVAALKLGIHLLQFLPLVCLSRKWVVPEVALGPYFAKILGLLGVAGAYGWLGWSSAQSVWMQESLWLCLPLAVLLSAASLGTCLAMGLAPTPQFVTRILKRRG